MDSKSLPRVRRQLRGNASVAKLLHVWKAHVRSNACALSCGDGSELPGPSACACVPGIHVDLNVACCGVYMSVSSQKKVLLKWPRKLVGYRAFGQG